MSINRVMALDVLRGLTIFLMIIVNTPGSWSHVYEPFLHAKWHGCTLTDLVFPSFLFVVGLSMSQSMDKNRSVSTMVLVGKILKRAGIIFLIGLLLNYFPFYNTSLSELRIMGVLQRIALSFLGAGILIILLKKRWFILLMAIALCLVHWYILYQFGDPEIYSLQGNAGRFIDLAVLGESHVYSGFGIPFDPEGLLGNLTGMAQVMAGYIIGQFLFEERSISYKKLWVLTIISLVLFIIAKLWNLILPINKPLWTGSYVFYTVSIVSLALGVLVEIIDKRGIAFWTRFFMVFGRNPLFSFVLSIIFVKLFLYVFRWNDTNLYAFLYNDIFYTIFDPKAASLAFAFTFTLFIWFFAWLLHRRNIILKV